MHKVMEELPHFAPVEGEVDGHRLVLRVDPDARLAALLDLIEGATESLRLYFYIFGHDNTARRVRDALIAARARGAKVWLLVDGFGSADLPDSFSRPMVQAGIVFCRFLPKWGRKYLLRNHQKMIIADKARVMIGGANISDEYFVEKRDGSHWNDLMLDIEGPAVARLATYFDGLRRWMLSERPRLRGLVHILSRRSDSQGALRWLFNGPFRKISPLTRQLNRDIDAASRMDMVQAYFAPTWAMLRRLGRIVKRGGSLRLITAAKSDNQTTIAAARHCYRRLLIGGAEILEFRPQRLHSKLIVIDDVVYLGSANFDVRSLFINAEIMLRIEDAGFAAGVRGLFAAYLPHSTQVTRESHRAQSNWFARARWLVSYFVVATLDFGVTRRLGLRLKR